MKNTDVLIVGDQNLKVVTENSKDSRGLIRTMIAQEFLK